MLFIPKNIPMSNSGLPWGKIIIAVILIGGVSYLGYQMIQEPKLIASPKTKENERG